MLILPGRFGAFNLPHVPYPMARHSPRAKVLNAPASFVDLSLRSNIAQSCLRNLGCGHGNTVVRMVSQLICVWRPRTSVPHDWFVVVR